ncbi:MAG: class I SAM-dependent methyltransferase [Oscillospiraceae bacterium]|nr:class I SAM-dependent methyltransferase [Oscillospiraceae bacterium]
MSDIIIKNHWNEEIKNEWNERSDEYYQKDMNDYPRIIENPERAFPAAVYPLIKKYMGDLRGKKILVPSSGDNIAVFGFNLLGAKVTSCDISENQLKNAKILADKYNFNGIEFICQDSMKLDKIKDDEYDLVYTSNGVHVWIDDMPGMYKNFRRVLKDGGYNIFFETHPMCRPFDNTTYEVKIVKLYEDIEDPTDMTYAWRTQDFVNAAVSAGFKIKEMREFHSVREDLNAHNYLDVADNQNYNWSGDTFDWKINPWAALPQCLCMCSQK